MVSAKAGCIVRVTHVSNAVFKPVLWLCPGCCELRSSGRSVVIAELNDALNDLKSQLTAEFESRMLSALEKTKRSLLSSLTHHTSVRPQLTTSSSNRIAATETLTPEFTLTPLTEPANPAKRRLIDRSPPSDVQTHPLLTGTAPITAPSHAALLLPPETPRFWLYLSRCRPMATVEEVLAFVMQQLSTDDVIVRKLVPASRDPSTLTFSSFKVGLSLALQDRALSQSTWPIGTAFKESVGRRTVNNVARSSTEFHHPHSISSTHQRTDLQDTNASLSPARTSTLAPTTLNTTGPSSPPPLQAQQ
ncbi:uncharacterized protein LOC126567379 [Anopheles maculipalpis]|uniref:uncharacterized protein LOC126567379 n=1 Tax=Anopheles maculipalpis TaxID=1496333 RepID=UPI00215920AC|nr:uncharacterized protein LOC126567379 [Anopheles maculipalpis]